MENTGIYYRKSDSYHIVKVFFDKREYYVGAFKDIDLARRKRDEARSEIIVGNGSKYRSRSNGSSKVEVANFEDQIINYPEIMDEPEYRIRFALLVGALRDICLPVKSLQYKYAKKWIEGKMESTPTYSFVEICELFNINPNAVIHRIKTTNEEIKIRSAASAD